MFRRRPLLRHPHALAFLLAILLGISAPTEVVAAPTPSPGIPISHGGYLLEQNGRLLAAYQPDTPFVPASIWKLATALHALTLLGPDFRFETRCYYGPDQTLYVQGGGDPMLVSEEVALIASRLRATGVREVAAIVLDDSAFHLPGPADGAGDSLNPYDVANSALAVNFNTIDLTRDNRGGVQSAEAQTPTLPLMLRLGGRLPPGTHRINISQNQEQIWQYTGELLGEELRGQGITVHGPIRPGRVPSQLAPICRHLSTKGLPEIIGAMLRYSNNFIANQLFLTCGAKRFGYPATWEKGREALTQFLEGRLQLEPLSFNVEEGSGLSRRNRITPRAMLTVLHAFRPYSDLLVHKEGVLVKSGTLNGVYCYAGYFPGPQGLDPFVLMLNQPDNRRDRLLRYLESLHRGR